MAKRYSDTPAYVQLILIAMCLVILYPFFILVSTSLKTTSEVFQNPLGLPQGLHWGNYVKAWYQASFGTYLKNSVFVSTCVVIGSVIIATPAAFALARYTFRGVSFIYVYFLIGMMLPGQLGLLSLFHLIKGLGLYNTRWALILPYIAGGLPLAIFILTGFFRQLSKEMEDAARIDGANDFQVFAKIMLPLARPAVSTIAVMQFMGSWNEVLLPLVFLRSKALRTLPVGLVNFFGQYSADWPLFFAAMLITILPVLVGYLLATKQFVAGLTAGAIKG